MINALKTIFVIFVLGFCGFVLFRVYVLPYDADNVAATPRKQASYLNINDEKLISKLSSLPKAQYLRDLTPEEKGRDLLLDTSVTGD